MPVYVLHCPWCPWFGMTTGAGDDSPAEFLKDDFDHHVRKVHPGKVEEARTIEPKRMGGDDRV